MLGVFQLISPDHSPLVEQHMQSTQNTGCPAAAFCQLLWTRWVQKAGRTMSKPLMAWYRKLEETPMWVAQVPAFFRMLGGLLGLTKSGSMRLRSASRPLESVVPAMPAPMPITLKMAPCAASTAVNRQHLHAAEHGANGCHDET